MSDLWPEERYDLQEIIALDEFRARVRDALPGWIAAERSVQAPITPTSSEESCLPSPDCSCPCHTPGIEMSHVVACCSGPLTAIPSPVGDIQGTME